MTEEERPAGETSGGALADARRRVGRAYFPTGDEHASLLLALATYGAAFLMRPVGAVVLGSYVDRRGRVAGLALTLGLMSAGTLTIALMPRYATIDLWAPALVLLGRLVQGLSAVELGGVSVNLAEITTPGHEGFRVSWQSRSALPRAGVKFLPCTQQRG